MANISNVILKQIFEAEFNSTGNNIIFRAAFTDLVKRVLIPEVEESFDNYSFTNSIIKISKMELDLGVIAYPFDEIEIRRMLKQRLKERLEPIIYNLKHIVAMKEEAEFVSIGNWEEELVLFFLKEGFLPWWASLESLKTLSITEIIDKIIISRPNVFLRILKNITHDTNQVVRLIVYTNHKLFFDLVSAEAGISVVIFEQVLKDILKTNYIVIIDDLGVLFKEFLIYYFLINKNKIKSDSELKLKFAEYAFVKNRITYSQLLTLFSNYYNYEWIVDHHPSYILLLHEYFMKVEKSVISKKIKHNELFLSAFFNKGYKDISQVDSEFLTQKILEHSTILMQEIEKNELNRYGKKPKNINYLDKLEQIIFNYLLYGKVVENGNVLIAESVQSLIVEWHHKYPDRLKNIVERIPESVYPLLFIRIKEYFSPLVSALIYDNYIGDFNLKSEQALVQCKKEIVVLFLSEGIVPWTELIGGNSSTVENSIKSFYDSNPGHFISLLEKSRAASSLGFKRKLKDNFSEEFIAFIYSILPDKQMKKELTINLPLSVDTFVYYLNYYAKHGTLPEEMTFTYKYLTENFTSNFPKESKLYFSAKEADEKKNKQAVQKRILVSTADQPIYIMNAGLVLLHPFLMYLFSLCGLIENRKFKTNASAHKAVWLLQYIVDREGKAEEHQLVLNKLLCGIPLSEPLGQAISITEADKEICENLIKGAIENWSILKKTSNDNFRVSFLQREGCVKIEEMNFVLKVQERGYDVLMDKLPWSISLIKMSIMDKVMKVDWK